MRVDNSVTSYLRLNKQLTTLLLIQILLKTHKSFADGSR